MKASPQNRELLRDGRVLLAWLRKPASVVNEAYAKATQLAPDEVKLWGAGAFQTPHPSWGPTANARHVHPVVADQAAGCAAAVGHQVNGDRKPEATRWKPHSTYTVRSTPTGSGTG